MYIEKYLTYSLEMSLSGDLTLINMKYYTSWIINLSLLFHKTKITILNLHL